MSWHRFFSRITRQYTGHWSPRHLKVSAAVKQRLGNSIHVGILGFRSRNKQPSLKWEDFELLLGLIYTAFWNLKEINTHTHTSYNKEENEWIIVLLRSSFRLIKAKFSQIQWVVIQMAFKVPFYGFHLSFFGFSVEKIKKEKWLRSLHPLLWGTNE